MFDQLRAFHRPTSVAQAVRLMRAGRARAGRGRFVAGGTDLVVQGDRSLRFVIDLTRLPLRYIRRKGGGWALGATATMWDIERSRAVQRLADGILAEAAGTCGSVQIRTVATVGGNLANASPAADLAPPLLALDASVVVAARTGRRTVPLSRFFTGVNRTVLNGALLVEVMIPAPPARGKRDRAAWSFQKLGRLESDIAVVNAAAGLVVDGEGRCTWARLALGAVAATPLRAYRAEKLLLGQVLEREIVERAAEQAASETRPISDVRASADYRREMSRVLAARALRECARRLGRIA